MTLIIALITIDLAIFAGLYFGFINKYVLNGQIFMSLATIVILSVITYGIYISVDNKGQLSSCDCSAEEIEQKLNEVGNNTKNNKTSNLEQVLCCFPQKDFQLLVQEDYQAIEANDTIMIRSKPLKTSIANYLQYLNTAYQADTIRVISVKKSDNNQLMYLEIQEINK